MCLENNPTIPCLRRGDPSLLLSTAETTSGSNSVLPSTRQTQAYWNKIRKGPLWWWLWDWTICHTRRGWESWGYLASGREGSGRVLSVGGDKKTETGSFQWYLMTGQTQVEVQEILFKHKWTKNWFYCKCDQTLEQVAQKGCGISILADLQTPSGHDPGQAALADPALSRGVRLDKLHRSLPASVIQWLLLTCR